MEGSGPVAGSTRTRYSLSMREDPTEAVVWQAPDGDNPARRVSQRSYSAVARKAKEEWLALFADDALLEDPVGPSFFDPTGQGHRGKERIAAFWDLAIAPVAQFRFTIRDSFANGNACANIGTFSTVLEDGTRADTDLIAVYRIDEEGHIMSMAAHWEVERTMATLRQEP